MSDAGEATADKICRVAQMESEVAQQIANALAPGDFNEQAKDALLWLVGPNPIAWRAAHGEHRDLAWLVTDDDSLYRVESDGERPERTFIVSRWPLDGTEWRVTCAESQVVRAGRRFVTRKWSFTCLVESDLSCEIESSQGQLGSAASGVEEDRDDTFAVALAGALGWQASAPEMR